MDVDSLFFSALLGSGNTSYLRGLHPDLFEGEWRGVFEFTKNFMLTHNGLPKVSTVKQKFKSLAFEKALEPVAYYSAELRARHAFGVLDEGLRTKYTAKRTEADLHGSVDALKEVVLAVERLQHAKDSEGGMLRVSKNVLHRKKAYLDRKKKKGLLGIKTPWPSMDSVTQGWQPGDLIVLLSRSGMGKSFWAALCELEVMFAGKNGLLASMEMLPQRLSVRVDALGAKISADRFRKGKLLPAEVKRLDAWYMALEKNVKKWGVLDICGPNEVSSPLDLELTIQLGRYDFVVWDAFYLAAKKKKWEEFAQLIADVKKVATRTGVPILLTSQFNKAVQSSHVRADQIAAAFTDSILHDADFVFALFQTPSMRLLKEMLLRSLKVREGIELGELLLRWDIDGGDFSEISSSVSEVTLKLDQEIDSEISLEYEYA